MVVMKFILLTQKIFILKSSFELKVGKKKHHLINLTCAIYGTYVFLVDYGTYEIFFLLADRRI